MKAFALAVVVFAAQISCLAGNLLGYVRDLNWYARRSPAYPYGVGCYEYAVNANAHAPLVAEGTAATDVFGRFQINDLPAGTYTVVSWDVWSRSSIVFGVPVPAAGSSHTVDLRLRAAMWGYPAFWDDTGYREFGQTFVPTGPISMIYLRCPAFEGAPSYVLTIHENGPEGPQIGVERTFGTGDQRLVYGFGEMPTVCGRTYYLRVRTSPTNKAGVIMQMDPRPDGSDPMPGGCLWVGSPGNLKPLPDRELGTIIMCDDDGLITDMFVRPSGAPISEATSIGQTFIARGVNLIAAAFWLADPSAPLYEVNVRADGPWGHRVGSAKRGKPARLTADPEMTVVWPPGECPLVPGRRYYIEVTRVGGGVFRQAFANRSNPFPYGTAWVDGSAMETVDLACTLLEEEQP
ncbi:MAG: carboxypeptidase-like regulatory domain-containing protein, partial [Verrucomicrobiae bacterium]|nr:carboxypeptidase-like regulatory domain-containing protein [Verrucomicrobiae bacterium]